VLHGVKLIRITPEVQLSVQSILSISSLIALALKQATGLGSAVCTVHLIHLLLNSTRLETSHWLRDAILVK